MLASRPELSEDAFEMLAFLLSGGVPKLHLLHENLIENLDEIQRVPAMKAPSGISVGGTFFSLNTFQELKDCGLVSSDGNLMPYARLLYRAFAKNMGAKARDQLRELREEKPFIAAA